MRCVILHDWFHHMRRWRLQVLNFTTLEDSLHVKIWGYWNLGLSTLQTFKKREVIHPLPWFCVGGGIVYNQKYFQNLIHKPQYIHMYQISTLAGRCLNNGQMTTFLRKQIWTYQRIEVV